MSQHRGVWAREAELHALLPSALDEVKSQTGVSAVYFDFQWSGDCVARNWSACDGSWPVPALKPGLPARSLVTRPH